MSGVKHTPGPWVSLGSCVITEAEVPINRTHGYGCSNDFICDLNDGEYHEYTSQTEQEANARLIAAAPDHHAVALELDRLMLVIESAVRFADPAFKDEVQALLRANKSAIARARGEQDGGWE